MPLVRIGAPPLKYLDGCLKLPSLADDAIFSELLPTEAVRHVADNTTLYSVVYRRLKTKAPNQNIGGPLIVTVHQSDLRAKKFRVLLKMKVDVRLPEEESCRNGVAVAVDEVAECVYVAYTCDEQTRSASQRRLLLRRVQLTLATADARGVRRLQRPSVGRPQSVTFEARNYSLRAAVALSSSRHPNRKSESRKSVEQLVLDGAALLLYLRIGQGLSDRGSFELTDVSSAVALLKLRKKSASMDVRIRGEVPSIGQPSVDGLVSLGLHGRWHFFYADDKKVIVIDIVHLLGSVLGSVNFMQVVDFSGSLEEWRSRHPTVGTVVESTFFATDSAYLLLLVSAYTRQGTPSAPSAIVLRVNLRSLLPPKSACANCHVVIRTSPPEKKQVCKVCHAMGFTAYSWVFGCHFCSAACLRDAWPSHSRLHHTAPLKDWTDADWQQWQRDNSKP